MRNEERPVAGLAWALVFMHKGEVERSKLRGWRQALVWRILLPLLSALSSFEVVAIDFAYFTQTPGRDRGS